MLNQTLSLAISGNSVAKLNAMYLKLTVLLFVVLHPVVIYCSSEDIFLLFTFFFGDNFLSED